MMLRSTAEAVLQVGMARVLSDDRPRCWRCNRTLAVALTRPWRMFCPRCKAQNGSFPVAT